MINIEAFYSNLKSCRKTLIFIALDTSQLKNPWLWNIYSANPLYVIIGHVDGYIEEKNPSKYLVFDSPDENREVFKK